MYARVVFVFVVVVFVLGLQLASLYLSERSAYARVVHR